MEEDAHRPVLPAKRKKEATEGPLIESPIIIIKKETAEGPFKAQCLIIKFLTTSYRQSPLELIN